MDAWLRNPGAILPGTRMPTFWPDYPKSFYAPLGRDGSAQARAIREHVDAGRWRYDDVAILVRSNDDGDQFLRSLNLQGIPWTFSGNSGLYVGQPGDPRTAGVTLRLSFRGR